jgi:hypothetical protein
MTRDHLLGWTHAARFIADAMPVPVNPRPARLVPVTERVGVVDIDPARAAEPEAPAAAPAVLGDGWIEWRGDECPIPDSAHFDIRFRDGGEERGCNFARELRWDHIQSGGDIVAYRHLPKGDPQ